MDVLERIREELRRIAAEEIEVMLDAEFEPETGELVRIEHEQAYWHLFPQDFEALLKDLPDGVGAERVRGAIEFDAIHVWHGPSPQDSRDERL